MGSSGFLSSVLGFGLGLSGAGGGACCFGLLTAFVTARNVFVAFWAGGGVAGGVAGGVGLGLGLALAFGLGLIVTCGDLAICMVSE